MASKLYVGGLPYSTTSEELRDQFGRCGTVVSAELLPAALSETLTAVKDVAPGLPSEVLLRRPDILSTENQLKGYNANIGAARAAFFPRTRLPSRKNGSWGTLRRHPARATRRSSRSARDGSGRCSRTSMQTTRSKL